MKPSSKRLEKGLWWDRNWPVLEGCSHVSSACDNCFAAEYAHRFENSLPYLSGLTTPEGRWTGSVTMRQDQLELPLKITKPTVWFVAERSDLFHPSVPDEYLDRVFAVMAMAKQHTFMVLTKRPEWMAAYFQEWIDGVKAVKTSAPNIIGDLRLPLPNLWLGTTIWDQASADRNIPFLLQARADNRFVSIEPMLGPIELQTRDGEDERPDGSLHFRAFLRGVTGDRRIDWVICGGESGRKARPVHPDWVRSLRDQCAAASVPFFFKQWGEYRPAISVGEATNKPVVVQNRSKLEDKRAREMPSFSGCYRLDHQVAAILDGSGEYAQYDCAMVRVGKKATGRLLDGKEHLEFP